jgi:hypothetical protein
MRKSYLDIPYSYDIIFVKVFASTNRSLKRTRVGGRRGRFLDVLQLCKSGGSQQEILHKTGPNLWRGIATIIGAFIRQ